MSNGNTRGGPVLIFSLQTDKSVLPFIPITLRGTVGCDWELKDTGFRMNVKVPFNCKAIVYVPSTEDIQILEGGTDAGGNKSISSLGYEDGYYLFEVGSGSYSFSY